MSDCGNIILNVTGTVNVTSDCGGSCECTGSVTPPITSYQVVKTSDQGVTNTTLVDDTELQFNAGAFDTWGVHFDLRTTSDGLVGNGRIFCAIIAPSDATVSASVMVFVNDVAGTAEPNVQGPFFPTIQGMPGSEFGWAAEGMTSNPLYAWARIAAQVVMGATSGSVGLQFCQITDVPSVPATVLAGSSLLATKASS
jgi:hypothetical protein